MNYYELLGLDPGADQAAIRKAYKRAALKHHPDKNRDPESLQHFHLLAEALEVLTSRRNAYDQEQQQEKAAKVIRSQLSKERLEQLYHLERREAAVKVSSHGEEYPKDLIHNLKEEGMRLRKQHGSLALNQDLKPVVLLRFDPAEVDQVLERLNTYAPDSISVNSGTVRAVFSKITAARKCLDSRPADDCMIVPIIPANTYSRELEEATLARLSNLDQIA